MNACIRLIGFRRDGGDVRFRTLPRHGSTNRRRRFTGLVVLCLLPAGLGFAPAAQAQTLFWTNTSDGVWTDAGSWNPNQAPSNNPVIYINNAGSKAVIVEAGTPAGNLAVTNLWVESPSGVNTLLLSNTTPLNILGYLEVGSAAGNEGAVVFNGGQLLVGDYTAIGNNGTGSVTMAGGQWTANGAVTLGYTSGKGTLTITDGTCLFTNIIPLRVGNTAAGTLLMTGGELVTTSGTAYVGAYYNGQGDMTVSGGTWRAAGVQVEYYGFNTNTLTIAGGQVFATDVNVGGDSSSSNGLVLVTGGGLLEANSLTILLGTYALGGNNVISNSGGVYQFTAVPTVAVQAGYGAIVADGATISFRATDVATVSPLGSMTYSGANTFRLNAASNTTSGQDYTFDTTANPTNYTGLEMINGATAYRGGSVTIGSGGSFLGSNTQASFTGVFTNAGGSVQWVNSVGTFNSAVVNNGTWAMDPSTNVFLSSYTLGSGGQISAGAGDLMEFQDDHINTSGQSNTFDTLAGRFLFSGVNLTQEFATAGKDLLSEAGYNPVGPTGYAPDDRNWLSNNFALGTLELSGGATVMVTDAFSVLAGNDDGRRAALYLKSLVLGPDALLMIGSNVSVYYYDQSLAAGAGFLFLDDARLLQLVPEPSTVFLMLGGVVLLWRARRRR